MLYREFSDQESIDHQYNPLSTASDAGDIIAGWEQKSALARKVLKGHLGLRFGPTVSEFLDIFPSGDAKAPLHLFIHGGYWRRFTARDFSFVAPGLVEAGISVAVMNYALCPSVTVREIVRQTRSAIFWLKENAAKYGSNATRLSISGHSAGAHLLAMALSTDWPRDYGIPQECIGGACAISGIFDLAPLPYSYLQPKLQLSGNDVQHLSPIQNIPNQAPDLTVMVGDEETDEFVRQSRDFLTTWQDKGLAGNWELIPGAHHFNILDGFEDSASRLFKTVLDITNI